MNRAQNFIKNKKNVTFLLVDDDEIDRLSVTRSFQKAKLVNDIFEVEDGVEALEKLREKDGKIFPSPYIILLDLNMPRMNGLDCLREIRKDPQLKKSIDFILTTSNDQKDIEGAYDLNVAGYIVKADAGENFLDAVTMIEHYWRVVEMPFGD